MSYIKYISLCSGVEAASLAWLPLDWEPVAYAEFDDFPSAVLAARFPETPNLGDVTKVDWSKYRGAVDLVVGGTPCQSFSIAGRREGLLDSRGQLMLEFVRAVREIAPRYVLWENVPGCLSQDRGRAFGTFLRELDECGYSCCWRVLDAQFARVPMWDGDGRIAGWVGPVAQRRRRVFLVAVPREHAGRAAAVLLDENCLQRNPTPSSRKREELAAEASGGAGAPGGDVTAFKWFAGAKARSMPAYDDGTTPTLTNSDSHIPAVAFAQNQRDEVRLIGGDGTISGTLNAQRWGTHKNETLIAEPVIMASGQANAEISREGVAPTIAARNYKDPPILFEQQKE